MGLKHGPWVHASWYLQTWQTFNQQPEHCRHRVSAFKEQPAPEPGQRTLADFVRRHPQHAGPGSSADEAQQAGFRGDHPEGSSAASDRENVLGVISPDHMRHMDRLPSLLPQQDGSRSVDGGFSDSGDLVVRGIAEMRDSAALWPCGDTTF